MRGLVLGGYVWGLGVMVIAWWERGLVFVGLYERGVVAGVVVVVGDVRFYQSLDLPCHLKSILIFS
jgi:hypothetical protein